jgi:hypothetical protein
MTCLSLPASAQEKHFGSWTAGGLSGNERITFAATINDSGGVLGLYCFVSEGNCFWLLSNDVDCTEGNRYPVLVNADAGSSSQEIFCMKLQGKRGYAFANFEAIDATVRASKRIGIAFPMADGYFSVSRFSLDGASAAISFMASLREAMQQKSTRDTKL